MTRFAAVVLVLVAIPAAGGARRVEPAAAGLLATEQVAGEGVWVDPRIGERGERLPEFRVAVWFDEQFLGDGAAYGRRAKEFGTAKRRELRRQVVATLKALSKRSHGRAGEQLEELVEAGTIADVERHWIVNGFTCVTDAEGVEKLRDVPGVKKVFFAGPKPRELAAPAGEAEFFDPPEERPQFDPGRYKHPWYTRYLQADRVWREFGVAGEGTLSVIHDFNFVFSANTTGNLYRNPGETPGNRKDDDGNGLVDDWHGYDFQRGTPQLTRRQVPPAAVQPRFMHGHSCATIVCGAGTKEAPYEFGLAPEGKWAGVIAGPHLEAAVEWAIEQGADTYSTSFSNPNLGELRSHWRKVFEQGSFCGVYFVSGAGNFARQGAPNFAPVPVQMRTPEDVPEVVFAAAGVQRDFSRTPFSSQGPVKWETEHYRDGLVDKPEVCAFNMGLPLQKRNGEVVASAINGNSFAGPMLCGSIALMLSADPDLLPWDLKEIITSTAQDVGPEGVDHQTGHGLIDCYRAVKEVLRRKAVREGGDAAKYAPDEDDALDLAALKERLQETQLSVLRVQRGSQAARAGLKPGDVIRSYDGRAIGSRQDLVAAKAKADAAKKEGVKLVVERDGERMEFEIERGPLGVVPGVEYGDPTFE